MQEIINKLKQSALFQGISEEEIPTLLMCLDPIQRSFKKGDIIHLSGDCVHDIGIVISGRVHIIKEDAWGNSNIITEIIEGELFAESVVCAGLSNIPATVFAASQTDALFLNFQRIVTSCSSACVFHASLIRNMVGVLAQRNIMLSSKIEHITKRTTREKLLSYLSEQAHLHASPRFDIPYSRQELADYLSVERSGLSAEMSKLKAEGIIGYRKNHFELYG